MTAPERLERFQNYISGTFVDAADGRTFGSLDPYRGEPWAAIPEGTVEYTEVESVWVELTGATRDPFTLG